MNTTDTFQRCCAAYRRRREANSIIDQPSASESGFETVGGNEAYVLRNVNGPLMAFQILASGRVGKQEDLIEKDQEEFHANDLDETEETLCCPNDEEWAPTEDE